MRCTSPLAPQVSSHVCHRQCYLQCPRTGPPRDLFFPMVTNGMAVPRLESLLQDVGASARAGPSTG